MSKTKKVNQGFSLIELLIAVTILSIVMIMVVQFMSTSSAAHRKTKKNLSVQTEAMQVLEQMSDTLMQAEYVRVMSMDGTMYTITQDSAGERKITPETAVGTFDYDFVPDNYGNYAEWCDYSYGNREVVVNFDTYELVDKATGDNYPLDSDADAGREVRSFRALKNGADYSYIMPKYIYVEYATVRDDGTEATAHVVYYITDIKDAKEGTRSLYLYRYETDDPVNKRSLGYNFACGHTAIRENLGEDGLITENLKDFYLSADSEGNAFLTNMLFSDGGYEYNTVETINFRNSNVLTVRPQKLYKVKGTGVPATTSTPTTPTTPTTP